MNHFVGKIVCVTGAGGSIGSELCVQLLAQDVRALRLVSISENALYNVNKTLAPLRGAAELRLTLADAGDFRAMCDDVLDGVDVVIHAAAHKHVPLCEHNPLEAIRNNVVGTYNLARAAATSGADQFVYVSSDKAVRPASIMGATKRASELMLQHLDFEKLKINVVRFGNVLDSAGSVFPLWREQIAAGGPVTITDPDCQRYFMSIPEAVELILAVASFDKHNPLPHVFDMGEPKRMGDLLTELLRTTPRKGRCVSVQTTGLRPGEKLVEELSYGGETVKTRHAKISYVDEGKPKAALARELLELIAHVNDRDEEHALHKLWSIVS